MFSSALHEKTRRDFLKLAAAGVGTASISGWMPVLANAAATVSVQTKKKSKNVILLFMDGGPSHMDTFDLKPDATGKGEFKPIQTAAAGVQISEHLPKLASLMNHGVIVRSMSTPEGAHQRAKYNMHTGYREGQGGLTYPSLGAIVASELGKSEAAVPNFISIGARSFGSGFLGPKHQPLLVTDPARGVEDLKASVTNSQLNNRLGLLEQMEKGFQGEYKAGVITDHKTTYERAVKLMHSKEAKAFDLSLEPSANAAKYGSGKFAEGCLMARRLIEVGVPFVEVNLGGWDTHQDNWTRVKSLSQQVDAAESALITDLKERGLLDDTLIVWMGDFGRTPKINSRGAKPGRDHYPRAWSATMFGGGLKGGRVVGKTDKEGATVEENKVNSMDFLATVCEVIGVDHTKQNEAANGRPIRIVDKPQPFTKLIV